MENETTDRNRARAKIRALSPREDEIFKRLARGESLADIARALRIGQSTASTYRARVLEKLHITTNADIAVVAHCAGMVRAPRL